MKQYYVPKIAAKLTELDPAGAATFSANATTYSAKLDALDTELAGMVAQIPPQNRKLVTFHDAFPYFARHYGFELIGVILANVGQEPTASELAALVEKVKAAGVKAVFSEAQFSPKLAPLGVTNRITLKFAGLAGRTAAKAGKDVRNHYQCARAARFMAFCRCSLRIMMKQNQQQHYLWPRLPLP